MWTWTQQTIKRDQEAFINIAALFKNGRCCGYGMGPIEGTFGVMQPLSPENPYAGKIVDSSHFFPGKKYFLKVIVENEKVICAETYFALKYNDLVEDFRLETATPPKTLR